MSISVVVPTYNRGPLVRSTLDSVLAQTLPPLEVIVVDDGSTDGTPDWIEAHYGTRVRVIRQDNGGVARARNLGLERACGEFIAFLDHDDLWLPSKLSLQLEAMQSNPRVGVVYSSWAAVDEAGAEMPPIIQWQRQWWWRPRDGNAYPWTLLPHPLGFVRNPIVSMSVPLIRTDLLRSVGGFDPRTVPSDDWDLWIRLSKICEFACVDQELVHYVHHDLQQHKHMEAAYASALIILRKYRVGWTRHPWLRFKQQCYRRTCFALTYHARAAIAVEQGERARLIGLALKATIQRPETLIMRRWHRLFARAFGRSNPIP